MVTERCKNGSTVPVMQKLHKYDSPTTQEGRNNCARVLGWLAEKAKDMEIVIGLEPVNRYESNVINTADSPPFLRGENLLKVPLKKGDARGIFLSVSAITSTLKTRPRG